MYFQKVMINRELAILEIFSILSFMAKTIEKYLTELDQMALPADVADKIDPDETKVKAGAILGAIFNRRLKYFIDTTEDEDYFLTELTNFMVKVFPKPVPVPEKPPKRENDKIKKARAIDESFGGALVWKRAKFKEAYKTEEDIRAYKAQYKHPELPDEYFNPPTNREEQFKFVEARRILAAAKEMGVDPDFSKLITKKTSTAKKK